MLMITGGAVGIIMCNARLSGTERGDAWEGGKSAAVNLKLPTDQTAGGGLGGGGVKNDAEDDDADTDGIPISRQDQQE